MDTAPGLPEDVARRLERALALFRGDPIELAAAIVERFDSPGSGVVETNRAPAEPAFADATGTVVDYACGDAGTASRLDTIDDTGMLRESDIAFSGCRVGAFVVDGEARRVANPVPERVATVPAPFARAELEASYPRLELRIVDSRDASEIVLDLDAQFLVRFPERSVDEGLLNRGWAAGVTLVGADGRTTLATVSAGIGYTDDGTGDFDIAGLSGSVEISGDGADGLRAVTMNRMSQVVMGVAFERDVAEPRFTVGMLAVRGDGFDYVLDADNGDPETFQLTVDADGSTSAFTLPWSERFDIDTFRPTTIDLGFGD